MSNAQVYVGTYRKYNEGSLFGKWLELEDYADKSEFHEACLELHKDEDDPELMFQDFQCIPEGMVGESFINEEAFEFARLSEEEQEMMIIYRADVNQEGDIEQAQEEFRGKFDSKADFAQDWYEESGGLEAVPSFWQNHIDWDSVVRDMEHDGFTFVSKDGCEWVFLAN